MRIWRMLVCLTLVLVACTPRAATGQDPSAVQPTEPAPTAAPLLHNGTEVLDPENPPPWLAEIFAELPERPEPDPLSLTIEVDSDYQTSEEIGGAGGTLRLEGPAGETYTLEIPENALLSEETITMTRVSSVEDIDADGHGLMAVDLQPEGLVLLRPGALRFESPQQPQGLALTGFTARGNGDEAHEVLAVEADGSVEFAVRHFSKWGYTSASRANQEYLSEQVVDHSPSSVAEFTMDQLSAAYKEAKVTNDWDALLLAVTALKRYEFWHHDDGVYWALIDALLNTVDAGSNQIRDPVYFERALAAYAYWVWMETRSLDEFYAVYNEPFPFEREVRIQNRMITQILKEGLDADCDRAIDAMYKLRFYRIAKLLQSNSDEASNRSALASPLSGEEFPEFTESYAREKVQECGRFNISLRSRLDLVPAGSDTAIIENLNADEMVFQFLTPVRLFPLELELPAPYQQFQGRQCHPDPGAIAVADMHWSMNIFGDTAAEFAELPLLVRIRVPQSPIIKCGEFQIPPALPLERILYCPYRFDLHVANKIEDPDFEHTQSFACAFKNTEGTRGIIEDTLTIEHDPDVGFFQ
jgi:hypothetical protein